ncbi:MAG: hypothetical protein CMI90_01920 [Pelagibacteraceae bacterium]|nr:hypothetical protein [Pelagibacteraceae bacterium]
MSLPKLTKIKLNNFRNFNELSLEFSNQHTLLKGKNAVGKTSILEAISFLSPGNGFKKDKLDNIVNSSSNKKGANIKFFFQYEGMNENISINIEDKDLKLSKAYFLNDKKITQQELLNKFQLFWFSEQDKIYFIKDKQYHRGICNRIICYFEPNLFKLLNQFLRLRREKKKILLTSKDKSWLSQIDIQQRNICENILKIKYDFMNFYKDCRNKSKNLFFEYDIFFDFENISIFDFISKFDQEMKNENESKGEYSLISKYDPLKNVFQLMHQGKKINQLSSAQSKMLILSFLLDSAKFLKSQKNKITIFLIDEIFDNFDILNLQKVIHYCAKNNFQSFFSSTDNFNIKEQLDNLKILSIK